MDKKIANSLRISYDKVADVLYLVFGPPKEGTDEEVSPSVFLRIDSKTRQPNGIMIIDFEKRFSRPIAESMPIDLTEFLVPA
ncbi:MAG: DUF2283 domain-containing protein [bacterium]|jgi:uncharacterized protein YuzE|nr:DUF2283 domain-containing protein [bacterium]